METSNEKINTIFVAGAGLHGEGYPNAKNTIRIISRLTDTNVVDYCSWLSEDIKLWKLATRSEANRKRTIIHILTANLLSTVRLLWHSPRQSLTYIPYPGIFTLWLLSWLPKIVRPRCISDAYITLWDSIYQDRKLAKRSSLACQMLLKIESRALRAADTVITDTEANADHLSKTFRVPRHRIRSMPLALNPRQQMAREDHGIDESSDINILFIGTFVPLQGTDVIAQAIHSLRGEDDIKFILIGDGQKADLTARLLQDNSKTTWLRNWQSSFTLEAHMEDADICLGIFGGDGKASRVLPFKIYSALRSGKTVISQENFGLPYGTPNPPMICCKSDPESLASAIRLIAPAHEERQRIEKKAVEYYEKHLSDSAIAQRWQELLIEQKHLE